MIAADDIHVCSPISEGAKIGSFELERRLGSGRFSTVWGCESFAIKVFYPKTGDIKYFNNEVRILNTVFTAPDSVGKSNVIHYNGAFIHMAVLPDLSPALYPCIVFERAVSSLEKHIYQQAGNHMSDFECSLPLPIVKKFSRELFQGLTFLHANGILHGDIKPGNLLISTAGELMIADLGSSSVGGTIFSRNIGTTHYLSPELVLDMDFDQKTDVWSACCVVYEMYTGELLFDVDHEYDIHYGSDVDSLFSEMDVETGSDTKSANDSQSSYSDSEERDQANYRLLLLMYKILGQPPEELVAEGRKYYNRRGKMLYHPDVHQTELSALIQANYGPPPETCSKLASFVGLGLKYLPLERSAAGDFLGHEFLLEETSK